MAMEANAVASMYAQIVNGLPKEESRHVTDDESSALWDQISKEVEEIRSSNPGAVFEVPNEVPLSEPSTETTPTPGGAGSEGEPEEPEPETPETPETPATTESEED